LQLEEIESRLRGEKAKHSKLGRGWKKRYAAEKDLRGINSKNRKAAVGVDQNKRENKYSKRKGVRTGEEYAAEDEKWMKKKRTF